jgi:hypothetical protein
MSFPFRYYLGDSALEVKLGATTVRRIAYSDIEGAKAGCALWNEHWTNFVPLRFITLKRRSGWIRNFVINPPDREVFLRELEARLQS